MKIGKLKNRAYFSRVDQIKNDQGAIVESFMDLFSRKCEILSKKAIEYYDLKGEQATIDIAIEIRYCEQTKSIVHEDFFTIDGKLYQITAVYDDKHLKKIVISGKYNTLHDD